MIAKSTGMSIYKAIAISEDGRLFECNGPRTAKLETWFESNRPFEDFLSIFDFHDSPELEGFIEVVLLYPAIPLEPNLKDQWPHISENRGNQILVGPELSRPAFIRLFEVMEKLDASENLDVAIAELVPDQERTSVISVRWHRVKETPSVALRRILRHLREEDRAGLLFYAGSEYEGTRASEGDEPDRNQASRYKPLIRGAGQT